MATVNLGRIKPIWKGAWNSGTQYIADDIVSYNNATWIAVTTSTNSAPANGNSNWDKMNEGYNITAGSIGSTELADGAITSSKLAAGVGGSWVKLASGTVSTEVASITYTGFSSAYNHYVFVMDQIGTANSAGVSPRFRLTNSGGTISTNYRWVSMHPYVSSSGGTLSNVHGAWSDTFIGIHGTNGIRGSENNTGVSGLVHIFRPYDSAKRTSVTFHTTGLEQDETQMNTHIGSGIYTTTETVTGFVFSFSSDNVRTGSYAIYGVAE